MDKYCQHQKIYNGGNNEYYFFTWSIPEVSLLNSLNISTQHFKMLNGNSYCSTLCCSKDEITFKILSGTSYIKCFVSMIIGNKTVLLSNSSDKYSRFGGTWYYYDLITLSSKDENFQKLKQNPNNTLAFICKIIYTGCPPPTKSVKTTSNASTDSLYNLRSLAAVLRNSPESSLKEKVLLRVGEETETVIKAVLCGRSPVFAKMFENDMKEVKDNSVTITDIKMPVLKALVSFLYTGKLPDCDFEMLCDLYYATDKYEVADLQQICVDLLIPKISMENIYRVMKLAFSHNDELLKSTVMALIATNIETWFSTNDWTNLLNEEPKIAAEVLNFFDF